MGAVAKLVEKELKSILQRDINKKFCEPYALDIMISMILC
jgi:hypothetical protein